MASFKLLKGLSGLPLRDQIALSHFGQGPHPPVPHSRVHQAFECKVDANPDAIAGIFEQAVLTYQQLDAAPNRFSNHLLAFGLRPKERVCLVVLRSLEMLVGIFAILKAGCQYIPIDGGVTSDKQLAYIFSDTVAQHILCLPKFQSRVEQFAIADAHITLLTLDAVFKQSPERPLIKCSPTDGCYAIYTSGKFYPPDRFRVTLLCSGDLDYNAKHIVVFRNFVHHTEPANPP